MHPPTRRLLIAVATLALLLPASAAEARALRPLTVRSTAAGVAVPATVSGSVQGAGWRTQIHLEGWNAAGEVTRTGVDVDLSALRGAGRVCLLNSYELSASPGGEVGTRRSVLTLLRADGARRWFTLRGQYEASDGGSSLNVMSIAQVDLPRMRAGDRLIWSFDAVLDGPVGAYSEDLRFRRC